MSHYDHWNDSELSNLPQEAWGNVADVDGPFDPDDRWLRRAHKDDQLIALKEWFQARFWDPANATPYNSAEGGYMYFDGGPYHPGDELQTRFGGVVESKVIEKAAHELRMMVGDDWARIRSEPDDYFDERFTLEVPDLSAPYQQLQGRLSGCLSVLQLSGNASAELLARHMVFSAVIGVLESFLWETVQFWVGTRRDVLQAVVTNVPALAEQQLPLGSIFERHDAIEKEVNGYLQNLVWHRWDKVAVLFKLAMGVSPPTFKPFTAAVEKRHDIVHRSGHDKNGKPISVSDAEIVDLSLKVDAFAKELSDRLREKFDAGADF